MKSSPPRRTVSFWGLNLDRGVTKNSSNHVEILTVVVGMPTVGVRIQTVGVRIQTVGVRADTIDVKNFKVLYLLNEATLFSNKRIYFPCEVKYFLSD